MAVRWIGVFLTAALAIGSTAAGAVTLDTLEGSGFEPIYGDYAPGGNCSAEPRVTIDATGLTFHSGGSTTHSRKVEFAASYMGRDYDGISLVFFPFPLSDYEFGRVVMTANADEQPGLLRFEDNTGPGDKFTPIEAALVRTGTFQLCGGAAAASAPAPAETAAVADTTPWELVPTDGGTPLAYVDAAGSKDIEAFSVFCSEGQPAIAGLFKNGMAGDRLGIAWGFAGGTVQLTLYPSSRDGTFWQSYMRESGLLDWLLRESGQANLRIGGTAEGAVSLKGSTATIKAALASCAKL
jgi:hypothetical protein